MHVLVTADTVGGVWTYARELVTGLARRGVRVTLVSFGEIPTAAQTQWLEGLRDVDYHATAFRLEWMQEAPSDIEASQEYLRSLIDEVQPDLLHLNQFCYGAIATDVPRIVVAHSDVVSWWVNVKGQEPPADKWTRWYRDTVTRGLAGASAVVAPSKWMLQSIATYYGKPAGGHVVYNGRTPTLFNPHVSKEELAVSVGRLWDGGKQVNLITQIEPDIPVCIAGALQHADDAHRGEASFGDALTNVSLKGPQTEGQIRHLFGRASMYLATSRYEPFGLAPLEAAFSRCALICSGIPTFNEIWGQTACYFDPDSPKALGKAIKDLRNDREMRLTYANLAYNRARQRYTAERMVDDYMRLYRSLTPAGVLAA